MTALAIPISAEHIVGPVPWDSGQTPPECSTLPELLDYQASVRPDAPALVAGDSRLSYAELAQRAQQFSAALNQLGVTDRSRVALLAPNIEEWLVAAFGALRLGVRLDTFNTWVHSWDLEHLLRASETEVLIMVPTVRSTDLLGELRQLVPELWSAEPGELASARFPALKQLILIGEYTAGTEIPSAAREFHDLMGSFPGSLIPPDQADGASTALVLYTSGTTQQPKAVPLKHRALIENGYAIGTRMGLDHSDRVWLSSPLFWSFGGANAAMATMTHGACLVLQEQFSPESAAKVLAAERCTAAYLLPSIALALADEAAPEIRAISSLRTGLIIGRPEEVKRVIVDLDIPEICNVYGSTEVYGNCCVTPHTMPMEERLVTQGPPLPGVELRVVDMETGATVQVGVSGELQIRGRVMGGYCGNPEATGQALTEDGWYRTGDTGVVRPDGTVQFLSRHTDMIKTSGINVSPSEVEAFIETHPAVEEVAVVGAPHPTRGEVPVAFVVLHAGSAVTEAAIKEYCKSSIASFKVPWAVSVVDHLPHTSTGKMVRKDLTERAAALVDALLQTP